MLHKMHGQYSNSMCKLIPLSVVYTEIILSTSSQIGCSDYPILKQSQVINCHNGV